MYWMPSGSQFSSGEKRMCVQVHSIMGMHCRSNVIIDDALALLLLHFSPRGNWEKTKKCSLKFVCSYSFIYYYFCPCRPNARNGVHSINTYLNGLLLLLLLLLLDVFPSLGLIMLCVCHVCSCCMKCIIENCVCARSGSGSGNGRSNFLLFQGFCYHCQAAVACT